eukprot:jgi/Chlat1/7137/Chrsp57S09126
MGDKQQQAPELDDSQSRLSLPPKSWPGFVEVANSPPNEAKHYIETFLRSLIQGHNSAVVSTSGRSLEASTQLQSKQNDEVSSPFIPQKDAYKQKQVAVLWELLDAATAGDRGQVSSLADSIATLQMKDKKLERQPVRKYDARVRTALRQVTEWLQLEWPVMSPDDSEPVAIVSVGSSTPQANLEVLLAVEAAASLDEGAEQQRELVKTQSKSWMRYTKIGLAAVGGGALLAVTGGLAAPALATAVAGLTAGTSVAAIAASAGTAVGTAAVAGAFGAAGAGLTGSKMATRTAGIEDFRFLPIGDTAGTGRLAVVMTVTGWLLEESDFITPWENCPGAADAERYAIAWETEHLMRVGTAIKDLITDQAVMTAIKQGAMQTVLASLVLALALPAAVVSAASFLDGPWTIALDRAEKAGMFLADVLSKRVIFHCLEELAKRKDFTTVETAVLLGTPVINSPKKWSVVRKAVSGRLINGYSTKDMVLALVFRASAFVKDVAGISEVHCAGVENVDCSELVTGHGLYGKMMPKVLDALHLESFRPAQSPLQSKLAPSSASAVNDSVDGEAVDHDRTLDGRPASGKWNWASQPREVDGGSKEAQANAAALEDR